MEFHWIPAHQEIEENELVDSAAKQATGWRKKRKKNGKIEERHDGKKAAQTQCKRRCLEASQLITNHYYLERERKCSA